MSLAPMLWTSSTYLSLVSACGIPIRPSIWEQACTSEQSLLRDSCWSLITAGTQIKRHWNDFDSDGPAYMSQYRRFALIRASENRFGLELGLSQILVIRSSIFSEQMYKLYSSSTGRTKTP